MSISVNSVFEVRQPGSDTNGGGFVTGSGGTDYSQQDAKNTVGTDISTTDAVANGTTTITSATANFGASIVGNIIYFAGGTGVITGTWRQVTARASATSITIDALIAASTGLTMNIGGALASPGQAMGIATIGGNIIYIKYNATPFLVTSATINIAGGCMQPNNPKSIVGYNTTRTILNADALRPTLKASGITTATIISPNNAGAFLIYFANLIVDGDSLVSIRGFNPDNATLLTNCKALNCTNTGIRNVSTGRVYNCECTGCSTQPAFLATNGALINCIAHDNTVTGFDIGNNADVINCISYNNSGASSRGFDYAAAGAMICCINCVAYNNGSHGFHNGGAAIALFLGCIAEANAGWGFNVGTCISCATYNNTSGAYNGTLTYNQFNVTNITGTFFTAVGSGDFSLNNTANQGALLRATNTGVNTKPLGLTVGFQDIGATQHQDSGGGTVGGFIIG